MSELETDKRALHPAWDEVLARPEAVHRVTWALDEYDVTAQFFCGGDESSPCRWTCTECESLPCGHLPQPCKCKIAQQLNTQDCGYAGPVVKPLDGPIIATRGDGEYTWTYAQSPANTGETP